METFRSRCTFHKRQRSDQSSRQAKDADEATSAKGDSFRTCSAALRESIDFPSKHLWRGGFGCGCHSRISFPTRDDSFCSPIGPQRFWNHNAAVCLLEILKNR